MSIRVCLSGISGWVGQALAESILKDGAFEMVSGVSRSWAGKKSSGLVAGSSFKIFASVKEALETTCDVLIDYTKPDVVKSNVLTALERRVSVVVGTSGLTDKDYDEIGKAAEDQSVGVIASGNFSLTAALLLKFSLMAAKHLPSYEILEYGSASKPDAPNGTTRELAYRLGEIGHPSIGHPIDKTHGISAARGATVSGTQIHSVRSPGFVSSGEVIFARNGERLRITQDTLNTAEPYVAGTLLAVKKVLGVNGLVRGMDRIMDLQ